jgi:hypothetical protein
MVEDKLKSDLPIWIKLVNELMKKKTPTIAAGAVQNENDKEG